MKTNQLHINKILKSYDLKLNKNKQFYHILKEIKKHDSKLKKLKQKEDWKGHFKEEVCDVFILSSLLMKSENVDVQTLNKASKHFSDKVSEIYKK